MVWRVGPAFLQQLRGHGSTLLLDPDDGAARQCPTQRSAVERGRRIAEASSRKGQIHRLVEAVEVGGLAAQSAGEALLFPATIGTGYGPASAMAPFRHLLSPDPHVHDPRHPQEPDAIIDQISQELRHPRQHQIIIGRSASQHRRDAGYRHSTEVSRRRRPGAHRGEQQFQWCRIIHDQNRERLAMQCLAAHSAQIDDRPDERCRQIARAMQPWRAVCHRAKDRRRPKSAAVLQ